MKYIISRYNHDMEWLKDYTDDYIIFDRSETPLDDLDVVVVRNLGTDIYDKFKYIVDNYNNLPDVAVYTKANLFKYITPEEFDKVKDNKTFTPLLTQNHKTYSTNGQEICRYRDGMYEERNNRWYLNEHPARMNVDKLMLELGIYDKEFVRFAPGSNYILPRDHILQKSKEFYQKMLDVLDYTIYPGEAQVMERGLYNIWS